MIIIIAGVAALALLFVFLVIRRKRKAKTVVSVELGPGRIERFRLDDLTSDNIRAPGAVKRRRLAGISCYVGKNGSGKSMAAVRDILPDLALGRTVLSNVGLLSPTPAASEEDAADAWDIIGVPELRPGDPLALPHPQWIPLRNFQQMVDFYDGVILLDEVQGVADSRDSAGLPAEVRKFMYEIRRHRARLVWTTIDWSAADLRLRQVTKLLTYCTGLLPARVPGQVWSRARVYYYRSYDPAEFTDFTEASKRSSEKQRPTVEFRQWATMRGDLKHAKNAYDSQAPVLALGSSGEGGRCITCGGKRRALACSCADHNGPTARRPEGAPKGGTPTPRMPDTDSGPECDAPGGHAPVAAPVDSSTTSDVLTSRKALRLARAA